MNDNQTCSTCKHWNAAGECELAGSADGIATHPSSLAVAIDWESYKADLNTKADFGCNQWKAKQ